MIRALAACAFFLASPAAAQVDGNQLWTDCQAPTGTFGHGFCMAYVIGAAEAHEAAMRPSQFCVPRGVTRSQMVDVVKKDLQTMPESRHAGALFFVIRALRNAFPCR